MASLRLSQHLHKLGHEIKKSNNILTKILRDHICGKANSLPMKKGYLWGIEIGKIFSQNVNSNFSAILKNYRKSFFFFFFFNFLKKPDWSWSV